MKKTVFVPVYVLCFILCPMFLLGGCGGGEGGGTSAVVSIRKMQDTYYDIVMDYTGRTNKEMGKALAEEILRVVPDYESIADSLLKDQFDMLEKYNLGPDFPTAIIRAHAILRNVPREYLDELEGMQEILNYDTDVLGDGRLSKNELTLLQIFPDVIRPTQCSAAAAFGRSSATGKTILGRNLDWDALPHNDMSRMHAVTTTKNGEKSIVMVHFLGMLTPVTAYNDNKIFGAFLDAETGAPYPADLRSKRSYCFDFRYALENMSMMQEIVDFLKTKDYAFNHLLFMADAESAGVLEQNIGSPGRGFRRADSELRKGVVWDVPDTLATVNDFRLPGNFVYPDDDPSDNNRWKTYRTLLSSHLVSGTKIDVEKMKGISGYYGTDGSAYTSGAVFLSNRIVTAQSIIFSMDTLEMWIHFSPVGTGPMPLKPTYIKVKTLLEM
jgi:hypothetical protein